MLFIHQPQKLVSQLCAQMTVKTLSGLVLGLTVLGIAPSGWAAPGSNLLRPGEVLRPGQYIVSQNKVYFFRVQTDGNVVIYERRGSMEYPIWSSGTNGRAVDRLEMQYDGNLVLYTPAGSVAWSSGTVNRANSYLVMQDDGNAVIYFPSDPVWSSRTRR